MASKTRTPGNLRELRTPSSDSVCVVYDFEFSLAQLMDGTKTLEELNDEARRMCGMTTTLEELERFVRDLASYGLLENAARRAVFSRAPASDVPFAGESDIVEVGATPQPARDRRPHLRLASSNTSPQPSPARPPALSVRDTAQTTRRIRLLRGQDARPPPLVRTLDDPTVVVDSPSLKVAIAAMHSKKRVPQPASRPRRAVVATLVGLAVLFGAGIYAVRPRVAIADLGQGALLHAGAGAIVQRGEVIATIPSGKLRRQAVAAQAGVVLFAPDGASAILMLTVNPRWPSAPVP